MNHDYTIMHYNCHYDAKHYIDLEDLSNTDNMLNFFKDIGEILR